MRSSESHRADQIAQVIKFFLKIEGYLKEVAYA